ncbi:Putative E3 ubiquitin-protein ligase RING1a [Galdieria sulphuraria]|nr:Putative E3 ubiquitin-protein ligase RING1a [Galdieria sulphuraria]
MTHYTTNQETDSSIENIPVLPLVFDSVTCKIPESLAKSFMTCPLCMGVLKKVTTIIICLHRFCDSCIKKYLQSTSMNCPLCGVRLSSLRQLRTDVEYGRLVQELEKGLHVKT